MLKTIYLSQNLNIDKEIISRSVWFVFSVVFLDFIFAKFKDDYYSDVQPWQPLLYH